MAGDIRVPVGFSAAEIVAQVFLEMGQRIDCAISMVLRRDLRQRVGLIAIFLEIAVNG